MTGFPVVAKMQRKVLSDKKSVGSNRESSVGNGAGQPLKRSGPALLNGWSGSLDPGGREDEESLEGRGLPMGCLRSFNLRKKSVRRLLRPSR